MRHHLRTTALRAATITAAAAALTLGGATLATADDIDVNGPAGTSVSADQKNDRISLEAGIGGGSNPFAAEGSFEAFTSGVNPSKLVK